VSGSVYREGEEVASCSASNVKARVDLVKQKTIKVAAADQTQIIDS